MSNSTKGIIVIIDFIITSFESPKRTHYLNPMRHHGASIENNYCHQPPPIVTQFIGIYSHFRISPISQSLLLILAQTQYPLEVESSHVQYSSIVNHDYPIVNVTIHHRSCPMCNHTHQCTHHGKIILITKISHPSNQKVVYYNLYQIVQNYESIVNHLSPQKEPMTWIFLATLNAPKSCTMQLI